MIITPMGMRAAMGWVPLTGPLSYFIGCRAWHSFGLPN